MRKLYNSDLKHWKFSKSQGKIEILLFTILFSLLTASVSCRSGRVEQPAVDPGDEKAAAENIAEADKMYPQREDPSKARLTVALLRQAQTADYGSFEAAWKLARADFYLGAHTEGDDNAEDIFREGMRAGKVAVQLQPNRPEGHFWLGANYGGSAQRSTLASLANVEDIRQEMETVIKMDERFQDGSAYMVLGQVYLEAPRVLGGDVNKAIELLQKGLRVGPNNALLRLHLAEAYHAAQRDAEARKQIDAVITITPPPEYLPEYKEAVEEAKKLEERIKAGRR